MIKSEKFQKIPPQKPLKIFRLANEPRMEGGPKIFGDRGFWLTPLTMYGLIFYASFNQW